MISPTHLRFDIDQGGRVRVEIEAQLPGRTLAEPFPAPRDLVSVVYGAARALDRGSPSRLIAGDTRVEIRIRDESNLAWTWFDVKVSGPTQVLEDVEAKKLAGRIGDLFFEVLTGRQQARRLARGAPEGEKTT